MVPLLLVTKELGGHTKDLAVNGANEGRDKSVIGVGFLGYIMKTGTRRTPGHRDRTETMLKFK